MVEILKTRSRTEIIGLILQTVEAESLTRSKIMYQVMLNFAQVKQYTSFLTEEGLLKYVSLDRKYAITDNGRKFLSLFNKTNQLLNISLADIDNGDTKARNNHQSQNLQWMPMQQQQHQHREEEATLHK